MRDSVHSTEKQQSFNRIKRHEVPAAPAGGVRYRLQLLIAGVSYKRL